MATSLSLPLSLEHYQLFQEIYVLSDACDRVVLDGYNLTVSEFRLLSHLDDDGGERLTHLSERLLLSKSTVTRIVDELERLGWAERTSDPDDRRAQRVRLTSRGVKNRERIRQAHQDSLDRRPVLMTKSDQQILAALLQRYRDGLNGVLTGDGLHT